eukprot:1049422_1
MQGHKATLVSGCFIGAFIVVKYLNSYTEKIEVKAIEECKQFIPQTVELLNTEWPLKNNKPRTMMLQQSSANIPRSFVILQSKTQSKFESIVLFIGNIIYGQSNTQNMHQTETKVIAHVAIEMDYNFSDNNDDDEEQKAMILRLLTHPNYRGRGYGKGLMAISTLCLASIDYKSIMGMCKPSLVPFYKKLGGIVQDKDISVRQKTTDRTTLRINIDDKVIQKCVDYLPNNQTFDAWRSVGHQLSVVLCNNNKIDWVMQKRGLS